MAKGFDFGSNELNGMNPKGFVVKSQGYEDTSREFNGRHNLSSHSTNVFGVLGHFIRVSTRSTIFLRRNGFKINILDFSGMLKKMRSVVKMLNSLPNLPVPGDVKYTTT